MEPKPNKNEALEALDFIINVLKEHEKDLDRLIGQLGIITESLGETGEITEKIESIEDKISDLQCALSNIGTTSSGVVPQKPAIVSGSTKAVTVKCRKWEDFKAMAKSAETVSYLGSQRYGKIYLEGYKCMAHPLADDTGNGKGSSGSRPCDR